MPPKAQANKQVNKLIDEKTFGMKNKNKSKKVQEYIGNVEKSAKSSMKDVFEDERARFQAQKAAEKKKAEEEFLMGGGAQYNKLAREAKKAADKKKKEEDARVLAAGEVEAVEVDPKTVLCLDFMKGLCMQGDNCKFSHDDAKARKSAKLSLYQDAREKNAGFKFQTEKVCTHFLDAVEHARFGPFWVCPNSGDKCIFRHCLPFGFIIKRDLRPDGESLEELEISEQIEIERSRLDISKCTPVTEDRLKEWMEKRKVQRDVEIEQERLDALKKSGNKGLVMLSGRSLFQLDPSLFKDDENAADNTELVIDTDSDYDDEDNEATDLGAIDEGIEATMGSLTLDDGVEVDASLFE